MDSSPLSRRHSMARENAEKVFNYLTARYKAETEATCQSLGYSLDELNQTKSAEQKERGTPSDLGKIRHIHHEERRMAKIMKLASEMINVIERTPSFDNLLKSLNITETKKSGKKYLNSSLNYESLPSYTSQFSKPQDVINYNYKKEKEKFNRSLMIIDRQTQLRKQENKRKQEKMKKFEERERKLKEEMQKRAEEHERFTANMNEIRKQRLEKKAKIEAEFRKQCRKHEIDLEERMEKLSEENKVQLRRKLEKKHAEILNKIKADYSKIVHEEVKENTDKKSMLRMMREIEDKIERRVVQYENNVKQRVQTAKEHSEKVDKVMSQSQIDEMKRKEEKLKQIVEKSRKIENMLGKKEDLAHLNSEKVKNVLEKKFDRKEQGIKEVKSEFNKKLHEIEEKDEKKTKFFDGFAKHVQKIVKEKIQKNSDVKQNQTTNYEKCCEDYERFKDKVMQKHFRLSRLAEDIKTHRQNLSALKRRSNLEVNILRNAATSNSPMKRSEIKALRETF
ncbi:unnamed protein product [Blepharisma stoltei]|uniref:Uncharacterized protein n=1 Tax=Blepharisma stoltei TaxID=1481888 RepID=A0AAU9IFF1_9CILI|nr:unnamed protein product [Blepharisma stoltei]